MIKELNQFLEEIKKKGELFESSNKSYFFLNNPEDTYLVTQGAVDLFFVQTENGVPKNERNYLFRAETDTILFGIEEDFLNKDYVIIGVGALNTQVSKIPYSFVKETGLKPDFQASFADRVDLWINKTSETLTKTMLPIPKMTLITKEDEEVELKSGQFKSVKGEVIWLDNLENETLFVGLENLFADEAIYFPICQYTWILANKDIKSKVYRTENILKDPKFQEGFNVYQNLFFSTYLMNLNIDAVDKVHFLNETMEYRKKSLQSAVADISKILEFEDKFSVDMEKMADENPFIACVRLVCNAAKVELNLPKEFSAAKYKKPLEAILKTARIRSRKVKLEGDWYEADNGPLFGFIDQEMQTPVAIIGKKPGQYTVVNPKDQTSFDVTRENADSLFPFAYSFYSPFPETELTLKEILKFALKGTGKDLKAIIIFATLGSISGMLTPIVIGKIYDEVIPFSERTVLLQFILALIVASFGCAIFQITRSVAMIRLETYSDVNLQSAMWDRLLKLHVSFFRKFNAGNLATRMNGINAIRQIIAGTTFSSLLGGFFASYNLVLLYIYCEDLIMFAIMLIAVGILVMAVLSYFQLKFERLSQESKQKLQGIVFEFVSGASKLRIAGAITNAFSLWIKKFKEYRLITYTAANIENLGVAFFAVFPVLTSMVLYFKIASIMEEEQMIISTGDFLAFMAAFSTLITAVTSIISSLRQMLSAVPLYENAQPIFEAIPEVDTSKVVVDDLSGDVEISHLAFQYQKDLPMVLKDVSVHIRSGEFVAFVGPSGSGKSTIFRLLLGFERATSGSIYFDGYDINTVDITSVRRQIGVVMQNSRLLTGPIHQNIVGQSTELTIDDAWRAAKMAGIDEDIKQMPMGMHTVVSEGGSTFSGGQRQRLMIARAIVNQPRILLMDEATSALDNRTQDIVSKSLDQINATRIVIAHRLSTIINADRICVIKDGIVAEEGNYESLMEQNGIFAELAKRQLA